MYAIVRSSRRSARGFTLIELLFVIVITAVMIALVANGFGRYTRERAAQQAAYLLSRDLRLARATAIGSRRSVSLVVLPAQRAYVVRGPEGNVIAWRTFAAGSDLMVDSLRLGLPGDSVTFNAQGVATLSGVTGGLAEAMVASPTREYVVRFNATGSSRIIEQ